MSDTTESTKAAYKPHKDDINSPDAIVAALYDVP